MNNDISVDNDLFLLSHNFPVPLKQTVVAVVESSHQRAASLSWPAPVTVVVAVPEAPPGSVL